MRCFVSIGKYVSETYHSMLSPFLQLLELFKNDT